MIQNQFSLKQPVQLLLKHQDISNESAILEFEQFLYKQEQEHEEQCKQQNLIDFLQYTQELNCIEVLYRFYHIEFEEISELCYNTVEEIANTFKSKYTPEIRLLYTNWLLLEEQQALQYFTNSTCLKLIVLSIILQLADIQQLYNIVQAIMKQNLYILDLEIQYQQSWSNKEVQANYLQVLSGVDLKSLLKRGQFHEILTKVLQILKQIIFEQNLDISSLIYKFYGELKLIVGELMQQMHRKGSKLLIKQNPLLIFQNQQQLVKYYYKILRNTCDLRIIQPDEFPKSILDLFCFLMKIPNMPTTAFMEQLDKLETH